MIVICVYCGKRRRWWMSERCKDGRLGHRWRLKHEINDTTCR